MKIWTRCSRPCARFSLALLLTSSLSTARAQSMCDEFDDDGPEAGRLFAAFNTTADGSSDGTVGVWMPQGGTTFQYVVVSRVHFEDHDLTWEEGPFDAAAGAYAEWFIEVPAAALAYERQYDYLSDVIVSVELYADGILLGEAHAGYARVAFDATAEPLVMLPDEAAVLAPGDAWNPEAEPRNVGVLDADVPPAEVPEVPDLHSHSEEVDG